MNVSLMWLLDGIAAIPETAAQVSDITLDSRAVTAGALFFALRGTQSHGIEFAADAAMRGAAVILWESGPEVETPALPARVFAAPVASLSSLIGRIADRFFNWPSAQLRIVGITGTNGKTTCAYLIAQCLERLNLEAAYIGTIGWGRPGALEALGHTTPDAISVHRMLARLKAQGVRAVAMEVSSHALDQGRVDGVRFDTVAFTNLSRDHLDYHPSMEAYGAAKAKLFAREDLGQAVINIGDGFGRELAQRLKERADLTAVWVGEVPQWLAERSLYAADVHLDLSGIVLDLDGSFGRLRAATRLLGRFNAENSVVVLGCLLALGIALGEAAAALGACSAPPGRMEVIDAPTGGKPLAIVDYAHTPDALAKALASLREHCRGELWCVFGCGGDRDAGKRPLMGRIADELADQIILTDDNPRSEDPAAIVRAIAGAIETHPVKIIHDRGAAIAAAIRQAQAADIVLIAGKGHEDYQIYGATRRSFSDRREVLRCLGVAA